MLEIRTTAIALNEDDLLELERIITDEDEKEAFKFLKKVVYERAFKVQDNRKHKHY